MTDFKAIQEKLDKIRMYNNWYARPLDAKFTVTEKHCAELLSIVGPLIDAVEALEQWDTGINKQPFSKAIGPTHRTALVALEKFCDL